MTLGQKIKKLRIEKELTQKELAEYLHVTFQTISKWEKDENEPDLSVIKQLASFFNVSFDYLLNDDEAEDSDTQSIQHEPIYKKENICPKCLTLLDDENVFCPKCGYRVRKDEKVSKEKKDLALKIVIASLILVSLILGVVGILCSQFKYSYYADGIITEEGTLHWFNLQTVSYGPSYYFKDIFATKGENWIGMPNIIDRIFIRWLPQDSYKRWMYFFVILQMALYYLTFLSLIGLTIALSILIIIAFAKKKQYSMLFFKIHLCLVFAYCIISALTISVSYNNYSIQLDAGYYVIVASLIIGMIPVMMNTERGKSKTVLMKNLQLIISLILCLVPMLLLFAIVVEHSNMTSYGGSTTSETYVNIFYLFRVAIVKAKELQNIKRMSDYSAAYNAFKNSHLFVLIFGSIYYLAIMTTMASFITNTFNKKKYSAALLLTSSILLTASFIPYKKMGIFGELNNASGKVNTGTIIAIVLLFTASALAILFLINETINKKKANNAN